MLVRVSQIKRIVYAMFTEAGLEIITMYCGVFVLHKCLLVNIACGLVLFVQSRTEYE
jgi:hypothetical protein